VGVRGGGGWLLSVGLGRRSVVVRRRPRSGRGSYLVSRAAAGRWGIDVTVALGGLVGGGGGSDRGDVAGRGIGAGEDVGSSKVLGLGDVLEGGLGEGKVAVVAGEALINDLGENEGTGVEVGDVDGLAADLGDVGRVGLDGRGEVGLDLVGAAAQVDRGRELGGGGEVAEDGLSKVDLVEGVLGDLSPLHEGGSGSEGHEGRSDREGGEHGDRQLDSGRGWTRNVQQSDGKEGKRGM